ncbi:uncharacterized protein TNCV_400051 [Trichonephila clavipes]|nr:uncharacterized protein TNCV_400051 [Trichonephila clavipes]
MEANTQRGKTSTAKQNRGRERKLRENDQRVLKRIVMYKMETTAAKLTTELNQYLHSPVSMITVRIHHSKQSIYGRAAISKLLITHVNGKRRLQGCNTHKTWSIEKWKKVICSDE